MKPVLSDAQQVFVVGETIGVRDLLATIDRGMADPTPTLHDTGGGMGMNDTSMWPIAPVAHNRAQRRAMRRAAR